MGFRITDTVKHILIINVIVFFASVSVGQGQLLYTWLSAYFPLSDNFYPWQIFTHMFMHGDQGHIFYNMLMLFFIGVMVEMGLGSKRFLFLYVSSGLGAFLLSFLVDYIQFKMALSSLVSAIGGEGEILALLKEGEYMPSWEAVIGESGINHLVGNFNKSSLGASGAIMGVLAALGLMHPNRKIMLLFPPIPIKIKYLVVGLIGSDLLSALLTGTPLLGRSNVGYVAHVGGALTGGLIMWYWKKNNMNKYRWN